MSIIFQLFLEWNNMIANSITAIINF